MNSLLTFTIATVAGAIASVAGFGIGSLLTPYLATTFDIKVTVAIVSIPHFAATAVRFFMVRKNLNRKVLLHFGVLSAIGGLTGATVHNTAGDTVLKVIFAGLLILAGVSGLTGLTSKLRLGKTGAWIAGAISGFFGGMVGNQGGIRSAALLSFDLDRQQFVATATAIALIVDLARMPVYAIGHSNELMSSWQVISILTAGCLLGTAIGGKILRKVSEKTFRILVSVLILALGISFIPIVGLH